ncbi:hypothetical protein BT93_L3181 [Corymbia citriodora subsp. variegata]|uniref:HMA domain-containing protein n=1 Tax=Corymbia citriodora subsp. variegata TaxID=360336 RepID=A0A8T0CHM1_CORYI|nr:hypothetical protein BT93_L3181 [Corymbia citriodora subsp. variegata]
MEVKVDLQCHRCHKKIKKILCGIPQVQDQTYDQAKNTVTITVAGGSPEYVRQKILSKGRCFVQAVDILPEEKKPGKEDKGGKEGKEDKGGKEGKGGKQGEVTPPVLAYPPVYVTAGVNVCLPCHNRGCDQFCPCNCHHGRPPMCHDGCGRPAHECRCRRPPICHDGCGRPAHECRCRRLPMCQDGCGRAAHECRCRRPPMCHDGCGRPAHECRCRRPSQPGCCDGCNRGSACSSQMPHGCGHGCPPVCIDSGYPQCDKSCLQM